MRRRRRVIGKCYRIFKRKRDDINRRNRRRRMTVEGRRRDKGGSYQ